MKIINKGGSIGKVAGVECPAWIMNDNYERFDYIRESYTDTDGSTPLDQLSSNEQLLAPGVIYQLADKRTEPPCCADETEIMGYPQDLNDIAEKHEKWLKKMNWWKDKTPLESLMLVVSECGEAANEVRGDIPTDKFEVELADIILRTLGIAAENNINIQQAVWNKMHENLKLTPNPNRLK
jgi:NTP pyrophosphatase (non-canonical NTP hydrolase)